MVSCALVEKTAALSSSAVAALFGLYEQEAGPHTKLYTKRIMLPLQQTDLENNRPVEIVDLSQGEYSRAGDQSSDR